MALLLGSNADEDKELEIEVSELDVGIELVPAPGGELLLSELLKRLAGNDGDIVANAELDPTVKEVLSGVELLSELLEIELGLADKDGDIGADTELDPTFAELLNEGVANEL